MMLATGSLGDPMFLTCFGKNGEHSILKNEHIKGDSDRPCGKLIFLIFCTLCPNVSKNCSLSQCQNQNAYFFQGGHLYNYRYSLTIVLIDGKFVGREKMGLGETWGIQRYY